MNGGDLGPPGRETDAAGRCCDALLIGLTFAAGVVDAVSYLGLGQIFTANMTGNVVFLALAVGQGSLLTSIRSAGALIGFAAGAFAAGRLLPKARPAGPWARSVTNLLWVELACLAAFASVWFVVGGRPSAAQVYLLIALSAFGMGIQNAVARHLAVPGLTTTVLTTALTGVMVDLPALGISGTPQRRGAWASLSLFLGAAVGATLVVRERAFPPIVTAIVVALVASVAYLSFDRASQRDLA